MKSIFRKRGNDFIGRSILGALAFLKESVFADEYALKKGFLQLLDPRIKVFTLLCFIVLAMLTRNIFVVLYLYALCLLLACFSGIHLGFFLKRTWIFIPLFSLFIAIPALFSVFTPGEAMITFNFIGLPLSITRQGISGASLFVARVIASVSFSVLLSVTTRHFELLRVLRVFKVPQIFVMTLGMCYRYIYLFVEIIENTYLAVKSRVGTVGHYKKGQHFVAWNIASLWQRSYQWNENVYQAMLSRGYRGEPVILNNFKIKALDLVWAVMVIAASVLAVYLDKMAQIRA